MATLNTKIVLRNDIAENWELHNPMLLAGETGVETDTGYFKIGDGAHNWNDLPYANKFESTPTAAHYEAIATEEQSDNEAINAALTEAGATAKLDDIAIVKRLISNDKYQYTAFVFNGTDWAAMSNDYNAENVYFDENIMITTAVGNISLSNGSAEIPAAGKNLKQVFESIWTKENYNPSVTNPAITLSISGSKSVSGEVGTTFTAPTATASVSQWGSFQFGSKDSNNTFYAANATSDVEFTKLTVGAAATAAALNDTNSASIENFNAGSATKTVTYNGIGGTFTDAAQTQKFSASATHTGSARKGVSNLGNFVNAAGNASVADYASAGKGIAANAGTVTVNASTNQTFTATGYRAWFAGGWASTLDKSAITGAWIRENLENKGKYVAQTLNITPGPDGDKCVLIAVPGTGKTHISKVELSSSLYMDITSDYTDNKFTVQVPDASGAAGTETAYTVYWYQPASLGADETHDIYLV